MNVDVSDSEATSRLQQLNRLSVRTESTLDHLASFRTERLDPSDPRWVGALPDPIVATDWFARQSAELKANYALARLCHTFVGSIAVEQLGQQCLLAYLDQHEVTPDEYEYVHHELIEESTHSQMFRKFVEDAYLDLPASLMQACQAGAERRWPGVGSSDALRLVTEAPYLYFIRLLAIEVPIDSIQRAYRRLPTAEQHPYLSEIYKIHITDEARHVAFADILVRRAGSPDGVSRLVARSAIRSSVSKMIETPSWMADFFDIPESTCLGADYIEAKDAWYQAASAPLVKRYRRLGLVG